MVTRSKRLVDYLASLSVSDLPEPVVQSAISVLLDNIGCGLFGAKQQLGHIVDETPARRRVVDPPLADLGVPAHRAIRGPEVPQEQCYLVIGGTKYGFGHELVVAAFPEQA